MNKLNQGDIIKIFPLLSKENIYCFLYTKNLDDMYTKSMHISREELHFDNEGNYATIYALVINIVSDSCRCFVNNKVVWIHGHWWKQTNV